MIYKQCKIKGDFRSADYRGTVTSKDDYDLKGLKINVHARNKNARAWIRNHYKRTGKFRDDICIERVQLMARGPRTKPAMKDFGVPRAYDQSLPHRYATHFDVYIRRDTYAMWLLQHQLENNLTPSQWNYIQKMERRKMWMDVEIAKMLKEKGIMSYGTRTGTKYRGM